MGGGAAAAAAAAAQAAVWGVMCVFVGRGVAAWPGSVLGGLVVGVVLEGSWLL
jgi:hypothetical protein